MRRTILIVDDNQINRVLLKKTLGDDYDILEAQNGEEALAVIQKEYARLSAVLLDIVMPRMDGYEVLRRVRDDVLFAAIPVIMVTGSEDEKSRIKALSIGANDFILKPFSPDIIKHCLRNNIALRETASSLNAIQRDKLTGLYGREAFFEKVSTAVRERAPGAYILSCFDIDNFKLINDRCGAPEGDRILREVGRVLGEDMKAVGGIGARISADNFACLLPSEHCDMSITRFIEQDRMTFSDKQAISISVGRYIVNDLSLPASALYDRAYIAKQSVKGRYDRHIAYFDDAMLEKIKRDQQIIADMDAAITQHQFEVWFQPQRNHDTGALVGAEALVRWRHPTQGLIPPNSFIPLFEQNGFIYELDKYVLRETCRYLRKWIDEGRSPLPVSVNLSRYDVFRPDLCQVLAGLLKEYAIPIELLRLEITESTFAQSTEVIVNVVKQLIGTGFTVEIDDFGSGYSSLNTLRNVPAQVVKLDMRFLESDDDAGRGGNILESIVRMTRWLGMSVIAEGVEDMAQADYLSSIGCSYIQGYLYAKPMPAAEYEEYCRHVGKEERLLTIDTVAHLNNNSFWNPKSMDTLIFNSYVGGACIFEYHNGKIELVRVTEKYIETLGSACMTAEDALKLNWNNRLNAENAARIAADLDRSVAAKSEVSGEYVFLDLPGCPHETHLRCTLRVIASTGGRHLVYCTNENITAQREAEQMERSVKKELEQMIEDMPGGFVKMRIRGDSVTPVFISREMCRICGMTHEEMMRIYAEDAYAGVHPADLSRAKKAVAKTVANRSTVSFKMRLLNGRGGYVPVQAFYRVTENGGGALFLNGYYADASEQAKDEDRQKALLDNLPSGAGVYEMSEGQMRLVYQNKSYWDLVGLSDEKFLDSAPMSAIHQEDLPLLMRELSSAIEEKRDVSCSVRLRHLTLGFRPVHLAGRIVPVKGGDLMIYATFTPITQEELAYREMLPLVQSAYQIMEDMPGGFAKMRITDTGIVPVFLNDEFCRLSGMSREELFALYEKNAFAGVHPDDIAYVSAVIDEAVKKRSTVSMRVRFINGKGGYTPMQVFYRVTEDEGGLYLNGYYTDATELNAMEEQRRELLENLPCGAGVYEVTKDGIRATYLNKQYRTYLKRGIGDLREAPVFEVVHPDDVGKLKVALNKAMSDEKEGACDIRVMDGEGGYLPFHLVGRVIEHSRDKTSIYVTYTPITEKEILLRKRAETDGMTGLYNKATTEMMIAERLAARAGAPCAMMIVDIDNLKSINDSIGHPQGDRAICLIADTLKAQFRKTDIVGRIGGDEFAVYLEGVGNTDKLKSMADSLLCSVTKVTIGEADDFPVRVCVGIAVNETEGTPFGDLYARADKALYVAKQNGKNTYAVYTDDGE